MSRGWLPKNIHAFRATPSNLWLTHAFEAVFGVTKRLNSDTTDEIYDHIADRPATPEYKPRALKPMLDVVGTNPDLTIILFTLDETAYGRELAQLAGVYPAQRLGPARWFFDSAESVQRYR